MTQDTARKMKIKATEENGVITLTNRHHVQSFPVRNMQKWISFYASMNNKYGGKTSNYARSLKALKDLQASMSPQG